MFTKILIANRGEIACRVAATAKRLGVKTVAVYSDADAQAKHVAVCDEAVHIGGSAPKDSYLRWERIIDAAKATGAQAIHPGYGFLSENEDFAQACADADLVFIGPPASAINAMGLKAESKRLMEQAQVPLVPGYHGADQDPALLQREADRIGYPVLIKASAGGGGVARRALVAAAARGFAHLHLRQGGAVRVRAVCILGEHARGAQQGAQRQRGARHGGMPAGGGDGNLHGQEKRRATGKRCGDTAVPTVAGPHERGQWLKRGPHGCMRPPPLSTQMQTILI